MREKIGQLKVYGDRVRELADDIYHEILKEVPPGAVRDQMLEEIDEASGYGTALEYTARNLERELDKNG